jgi:[ribosomal protein S5]-alanine N-acetyltransferase
VLQLVRRLSPYLPLLRARSASLGDQLERALISVPLNIAEGARAQHASTSLRRVSPSERPGSTRRWISRAAGASFAIMADSGAVVLETAQLRMTLPNEDDARALADYLQRNHEHLRPWSPPEAAGARTTEGALRRIQKMHAERAAQTSLRLWIRWRADPNGPFIGAVSLANIMLGAFRACYLGYHLDRDLVGRGLMHEALQVAIRHAFDDLLLHRIMANYVPSNERSAHLLRRLGFVIEGYARDYLFIDGQFRDHVLTSLTNPNLANAERLCTPTA